MWNHRISIKILIKFKSTNCVGYFFEKFYEGQWSYAFHQQSTNVKTTLISSGQSILDMVTWKTKIIEPNKSQLGLSKAEGTLYLERVQIYNLDL